MMVVAMVVVVMVVVVMVVMLVLKEMFRYNVRQYLKAAPSPYESFPPHVHVRVLHVHDEDLRW